MRSQLSKLTGRLTYLIRSRGFWGTLQRAFAQLLSPILRVDNFYISMSYYNSGFDVGEERPDGDDKGIHTVIVESAEELEKFGDEIDDYFGLDASRDFLAGGPKRFIVLSQKRHKGGSSQVAGIRTCEIGVFSIWEGKRRIELPDNTMMVHNNEVHPKYRGQRVTAISRKALYAYALKKGVNRTAGTIETHNLSSLKAHARRTDGRRSALKGKIRRVRILGGLIDWMTPAGKIKALIEAPHIDCDN